MADKVSAQIPQIPEAMNTIV